MLKSLMRRVDNCSVAYLLKRNSSLLDENTILRRENARFLGVVAAKEREILQLKGQIAGRDAILRRRRDAEGKFA